MSVNVLKIAGLCVLAVGLVVVTAYAVVGQPRFGELPEGEQLDRVKSSPNYRDDKFQNVLPTPVLAEDSSMFSVMRSMIFDKKERLVPDSPVPVVKTDLKALPAGQNVVVWLGHSSWYVQINGLRFLIDPVFNDYAAPFSFANKAFAGTSMYSANDIPDLDGLLITHDHWDHLEYQAVMDLKDRVKAIIVPLGVGSYFENWGVPRTKIHEGDWNDSFELSNNVVVHVLQARHYTGRLFTRDQTLWAGFAIVAPDKKIFISGDSGYGPHYAEIGNTFGGFDLVLVDCGQYDPRWPYIHMNPEEAVMAAVDLKARVLVPSHVGRFALANHPWDEPFIRVTGASRKTSLLLRTPRIGEPQVIDATPVHASGWWVSDNVSLLYKREIVGYK